MARYARIADGRVAEIIELDGIEPSAVFHPDVVASFVTASALAEPGWSYANGKFTPPPPPAPPTKAELIAYAADARWRLEVAGVTIPISGEQVLVSTNRGDDRAALHMTYSALKDDLRKDGDVFNFADGLPRSVSNAEMEAAILAALAHVQSAFNLGLMVRSGIEAGEITTAADVDEAFA